MKIKYLSINVIHIYTRNVNTTVSIVRLSKSVETMNQETQAMQDTFDENDQEIISTAIRTVPLP